MAATPKPRPVDPDVTTAAFLTPDDLAALLRVDVRTIRRWCGDGQVKGARLVGRTWRLPRVEVERFLGHTLAELVGGK